MASVLDAVKYYQQSIEKHTSDEEKVLKCIDKLYHLDVTTQHLQETGVGRTVNALRKDPGDVGAAARSLVYKWKRMVAAEESDHEGDQRNDPSIHNGSSSGKESDDNSRQNKTRQEPYENSTPKSNITHQRQMNGHTSDNKRKYHSSEEDESNAKKIRHSVSDDDHTKPVVVKKEKLSESESDGDSGSSESDSSYTSESSQDTKKIKEEKQEIKIKKEKTDSPERHKSKDHSNPNHKAESSSKRTHESSRHSNHSSKLKDSRQPSESKSSSNKHKSSHDRESSSDKKHKSEQKPSEEKRESKESKKHDSEKHKSNRDESHDKQKSSSDSLHKPDRHRSLEKDDKHKSSSSKSSHSKKESDRHRKSSHTDKDSDKHKSSDRESSKHKSIDRSSKDKESSSSKDKHSSSSKEKSKDRSSSSKEKSSSHSEKKHSSSDSKSQDKVRVEKSEDRSDKKSKEQTSLLKSKSSSKSKDEVPKKKIKISNGEDNEEGIDCGSGASFAEALGMMVSPIKPKKSKVKDTSPNNSFNNDLSPAALLAPTAKLAPLPALEISALPEISPNYKPRPPPKPLPHFTDEDAISAGISSKNQRTKVYSGNKILGKVTSLYEMCVNVLQEHIDALEFTGGVPYDILKPVIDRATPNQLFMLEHYNPYLMDDTDHLWQKYCEKNFRNKKRQEMETWREMYMRCQEEQESKLKSLTANIRMTQEAKKAPIKQTKMAYVDTVVKPPRNIARKQALHGTAHTSTASPAARVASLAAGPNILKGGAPRPPNAAPVSSSSFKPKKAPLMQKALQFMRGRKR